MKHPNTTLKLVKPLLDPQEDAVIFKERVYTLRRYREVLRRYRELMDEAVTRLKIEVEK